jgi:ribosomal small subunit protein bTHX
MGKGDKKSKKGKRWRSSFGVSRNKQSIKTRLKRTASKKTTAVVTSEAAPKKRAPRKKTEA